MSAEISRAWRWSPGPWVGMEMTGWFRLLVRNRFAVGPERLPRLVLLTLSSLRNTGLGYVQRLRWGKCIRNATGGQAPLFVIGHWRTGTTWLHELLTLDPRHTSPTTYACIFPSHFLLTETFMTRWFGALLPDQRPMDNMAVAWDRPQEDEFALGNLGLPSPYLTMAFPNRAPHSPAYYALEQVPPEALEHWKQTFVWFLKCLSVRDPRRLVLKSPTHTYRLKVLMDLFPQAQFVHIVRNPYVVFPSTVRMLQSLYRAFGLQRPTFHGLEEYVFENFECLYEKLDAARPQLDDSRFYELRYEDLVRDPLGQLGLLYESLELGDFDQVVPRLRQYLAKTANYRTNGYDLPSELRDRITQRWGHIMRRYGYTCGSPRL
jgi:hypothetical protein